MLAIMNFCKVSKFRRRRWRWQWWWADGVIKRIASCMYSVSVLAAVHPEQDSSVSVVVVEAGDKLHTTTTSKQS